MTTTNTPYTPPAPVPTQPHSIEHFRDALSRMPEKKFFEIARSLAGDLKTPYNKQHVIDSIIAVFSNKDAQETIASYITEKDRAFCAALKIAPLPGLRELKFLCSSRFSAAECERIAGSLEERLVIYKYDATYEYYALNPLLDAVFSPHDARPLFPCIPAENAVFSGGERLYADSRMIAAFFSFLYAEQDVLKKDRTVKKKVMEKARRIFPDELFLRLCQGGVSLGLLHRADAAFIIDEELAAEFCTLPPIDCFIYMAAGLASNVEFAPRIFRFLSFFEEGSYMTAETAERLFYIALLEHRDDTSFKRAGSLSVMRQGIETFTEILRALGLVTAIKDTTTGKSGFAPIRFDRTESENSPHPPRGGVKCKTAVPIVFDSPFSFHALPGADAALLFPAMCFSRIESGADFQFVISRESVVQCFKSGRDAAWITGVLKKISGDKIDETLLWTINEWEKRHKEVVLYRGLMLYLDAERRHLAETDALKPFLRHKITDGVFTVDAREYSRIKDVIHRLGVDIIGDGSAPGDTPRRGGHGDDDGDDDDDDDDYHHYHHWDDEDDYDDLPDFSEKIVRLPRPEWLGAEPPPERDKRKDGAQRKKQFHALLASLQLDENDRAELASRIERGLIINEAQLQNLARPGVLPYEKVEARGMDYAGKLAIARSAHIGRFPVEITVFDRNVLTEARGGGAVCCFIEEIEKTKDGDILKIQQCESGIRHILPLGKAGVIRKIKRTLFD